MLRLPLLLLLLPRPPTVRGNEVFIACQRDGDLALTYDQGPAVHTGRLLAALSRHRGVRATFHFTPEYLENPVLLAYLKRAVADGHLVGLYVRESAITQADGANSTQAAMAYIERSRAALQKHTNYPPVYLRFPLGATPPDLLKAVWAKGMVVTGYNLDSQDYLFVNDTTPPDGRGAVFAIFRGILDAIEPPAKGAFIAIQRDLVGPSVDQSEAIMEYALQKGYRLVRLDECLGRTREDGSGGAGADGGSPLGPIGPQERNGGANITAGLSVLYYYIVVLAATLLIAY